MKPGTYHSPSPKLWSSLGTDPPTLFTCTCEAERGDGRQKFPSGAPPHPRWGGGRVWEQPCTEAGAWRGARSRGWQVPCLSPRQAPDSPSASAATGSSVFSTKLILKLGAAFCRIRTPTPWPLALPCWSALLKYYRLWGRVWWWVGRASQHRWDPETPLWLLTYWA